MIDKLKRLEKRYEELSQRMSDPEAMADRDVWRDLTKEHASLGEIVSVFHVFEQVLAELEDCRLMLEEKPDPEMAKMIHGELAELEEKKNALSEQLKLLLLPKDPNDDRGVILEIRAGTGGDEASLFGADLLRMYLRYAERQGYQTEYITNNMTDMGGVKEVVLAITGKRGAYSRLKFESGVHRVQRVPETESQGRIHTSAATVAVLPEVDDVQVELKESDLRIDTRILYRSRLSQRTQ